MTPRLHKRPRLADDILRARCEIAKRVAAEQPLDDAALTAIGFRFDVDATALAAGMILRQAFGPRIPREIN